MMQSRNCEHVLQKTDLPTLGVKLPKRSDLPKETKPWSDVKLPVDILLLTLEDCEFLSCYVHLRNTYKSYHKDLGFGFFGTMGECGEEQLKVALIRCCEGSSCPDYSQITIRNPVMQLRPKAVVSVSYYVSLNPEDTKLGDFLVFSRITVNDLGTTATRDLSILLRQSADGRNSPFLNRDDNRKFFSNIDPVRSKRRRSSSGVIASRIEDFSCLEEYQKRLQMICAGGKVKIVRWKKCLAIFFDDIRTQLSWFMGDRKSNGLTQPRICQHMETFLVASRVGKRIRGKSRPVSGAIPENGTFRFKVNEQSSWHHCKVVSSGNGFAESSQTSFCILVAHSDQFNSQLRLRTPDSILLPRSKRQGSDLRILSTEEDVLQDENEEGEEVHIVSNLFEEFHTDVDVPLCPRRCPSSSQIACLHAKLPEKPSPDACYPPNREEGLTTSECLFGFVKNQDDQREYLQSIQSSIPGDSEKEKFNGAVDPSCNPQDIDASDFESSLGNHCEVQCNAWDEDLSGHQNQLKNYSDACRQSVLGLSPLTNSEKTVTGTQTEDCFGPVVANLENELAASQNICHKLQQKIKWLEEKLELCDGENHKLQADLGKYLFFEEKEKRLSAVSGRRNELLGHLVSGEATTDYDGSCSFNNPPDSTLSVMNEASKHSQVRSLSGRKTEPQEQAPGSAPDDSVALQDKHVDEHLNRQDRNGLIFYGTSPHSSSNAELFQENDTTSSEERADHEHKQCTLLPCNQSSEKTDDVPPESSMNADCHLPSSQGAVIANDYPWTSKPFDASVSSNSSQCVADSKIPCDNSRELTCFEENPKPSVGKGVDWKDENVEMSGPHAANGEERVERAVDSAGDAVSAANRPSSCETNWERLGARPKQPQHSLVAERPREPLVSATDGLAANFLARHTQDKALQDSLYQSTGTPSPVFSENSHGTSYVDGYAPEPNRATTYCGGLSFPAETDPHRRKENPFLSALSEEFDRRRTEGNFSYEHLYDNTTDADAPDGPFDSHLGEGNFSRFRNYSSKSTSSAVNSHTFQSGFVENIHVLARNNHHELVKDQSVLPDSCSAFNSEPTNTTQQHWSIPGRVSVVRPSGCTTTFEDACLAQGSTHDTSILEPRYGDADSYRSSVWNNRDFGTDSVESSDNSLLALERRVAEASALVERVLREREEREQFGREIERKEQMIREQRAKERREKEERELREAENWPQQQEAINARSQWLCEHYQRHCRVRFPCCTQFYPCHRCHNISKACENEEAKACHATHLKCSHCQEEQEIGEDSAHCRKCGGKMSAYFCAICKHFTSIDKNPYHCDKCGICRIHQDKSFHCEVCNVCLDKRLEGNHKCRPDSGHDECCICLEDAFSGCQILPCSHKVHRECAIAMIQNGIRTCPICRHPLYSQPRE